MPEAGLLYGNLIFFASRLVSPFGRATRLAENIPILAPNRRQCFKCHGTRSVCYSMYFGAELLKKKNSPINLNFFATD